MLATRRDLGKLGLGLFALPVVGCASGTSTTVATSVILGDVTLALNALESVDASTVIETDLGTVKQKAVFDALTDANQVLTDINASAAQISFATAQGWVEEINSDADVILPILLSVAGLTPAESEALTAVQVILPILLAAVGSSLATSRRAAAPKSMSAAQARAVLKAFPVKRVKGLR